MNIQFSSRSDRWYTPLDILDKCKQVLGHIDLDPASDEFGNNRVCSKYYINKEKDGLKTIWQTYSAFPQTLFINPPGGKTRNRSNTELFWSKLMDFRDQHYLKHAIFLAFSLEALQTTQRHKHSICDFTFCVPKTRMKFDSQDGTFNAPSHSNAIVYVPGSVDMTEFFIETFKNVGAICKNK